MPDDKLKRREQAKIRSAMKQRESKRLRMAQSIQRELEEVAVKQADLEREGVVVEKAMRSGNGKRLNNDLCRCLDGHTILLSTYKGETLRDTPVTTAKETYYRSFFMYGNTSYGLTPETSRLS